MTCEARAARSDVSLHSQAEAVRDCERRATRDRNAATTTARALERSRLLKSDSQRTAASGRDARERQQRHHRHAQLAQRELTVATARAHRLRADCDCEKARLAALTGDLALFRSLEVFDDDTRARGEPEQHGDDRSKRNLASWLGRTHDSARKDHAANRDDAHDDAHDDDDDRDARPSHRRNRTTSR